MRYYFSLVANGTQKPRYVKSIQTRNLRLYDNRKSDLYINTSFRFLPRRYARISHSQIWRDSLYSSCETLSGDVECMFRIYDIDNSFMNLARFAFTKQIMTTALSCYRKTGLVKLPRHSNERLFMRY